MVTPADKGTIMFVHGLWLSPRSWEHWVSRFEGLGYNVLAPAWPGVAEFMEPHDPDKAPADIGVGEIVDHYVRIIESLTVKPVVVGHSFGGLVAEILNDRGLTVAAVAMSPAPVKGVYRLPIPSLRTASVALRNPANLHRAVKLTPAQWQYSFTNTLPPAEGREYYERYAIPGPGRTLFQAATANVNPNAPTKVNFRNPNRGPLLFVGASEDHTVPASVTREAYQHHRRSPVRTDYKLFEGRDHFTAGAPGWEAVADYVANWIADVTTAPTGAAPPGAGEAEPEPPVTPPPAAGPAEDVPPAAAGPAEEASPEGGAPGAGSPEAGPSDVPPPDAGGSEGGPPEGGPPRP
jgi:pimeloyl-ACP methyl ester carboxylesterase